MPSERTNTEIYDLLTEHVATQKGVADGLAREQKTVRRLLVEIHDQVSAHEKRISVLEVANSEDADERTRLEACEQAIVKLVQRIP